MKKMLCLVMVLMMSLIAISAFAAGSITGGDITTTTVSEPTISLEIIEDTEESAAVIDAFKDAFDAGDVLAALPDSIRAALPEDAKAINEMVTTRFAGDVASVTSDVAVNIVFDTQYPAGESVSVLFGKLGGEEVAWTVLNGTVQEDGSVNVTVPLSLLQSVQNEAFVLAVVSAE